MESSNPHEQHYHTTNSKLQIGDGDGKWEHFQHLKKKPQTIRKNTLSQNYSFGNGKNLSAWKQKKNKVNPFP